MGSHKNVLALAIHRPAVEIAEPHAAQGEHGHIAIGQEDHVLRVGEDGGHIGRHEVFVVAGAHHQRRLVARRDNFLRVGARNHRQGERSAQVP